MLYSMPFTMTATLRPEIVNRTLYSFSRRLKRIKLSDNILYLNIDPMPEDHKGLTSQVITVAESYFKQVVTRTPNEANFSSAIKWLWSQPKTEFIFHLEDDWEATERIDVSDIMKLMKKNSMLYQVRLCKFLKSSARDFYGLSPCVIRNTFYPIVAKNLLTEYNPERQLRKVKDWGLINRGRKTVCAYPPNKIVMKDIGREWRVKHHMSKKSDELDFVKWEWREKIIK